jgi:hypothetical protein
VVDVADRCDAWNRLSCVDHAALHLCGAVAGVACHIQLALHQHCVLWFKPEVAVQRARESAYCNQRGSDEDRANGNLHDQQNVSQGEAPHAGHAYSAAAAHHLPRISAHDLANRHDPEEETAAKSIGSLELHALVYLRIV